MTTTRSRFCTQCGKPEGKTVDGGVAFRSPLALKCRGCDKDTAEERREYHRNYHKARNAAIGILVDRHAEEFEELLAKERVKVDRNRKRAERSDKADSAAA